MSSHAIAAQAGRFTRAVPEIRPGFTVRVHERIQEGGKERIQVFEGLVISVHKGHVPTDHTFTVRKIVGGIGVEKIFAVHSPLIDKIEVKKVAKVRRAKLFFLRGRTGKAARLVERFTTEGEFVVAQAEPEAPVTEEAPEVSTDEPEMPVEQESASEESKDEEKPAEVEEAPEPEKKEGE